MGLRHLVAWLRQQFVSASGEFLFFTQSAVQNRFLDFALEMTELSFDVNSCHTALWSNPH
jgi:hypothetical protein